MNAINVLHLLWIIPVAVLLGVYIGHDYTRRHAQRYLPTIGETFGYDFGYPPYAGFDARPSKARVEITDHGTVIYDVDGNPLDGFDKDPAKDPRNYRRHYNPGDPAGIYGYEIGDEIHKQIERFQEDLVHPPEGFVDMRGSIPDPHGYLPASMSGNHQPGKKCGPACYGSLGHMRRVSKDSEGRNPT